ncbi:MAG TPA: hypothetical protein VH583_01565 [Vicinamibacterales bacterium]|jgi:hypothetical protein
MKRSERRLLIPFTILATGLVGIAQSSPTLVTVDNYNRAESDISFAGIAKGADSASFRTLESRSRSTHHPRNRDPLYSVAVFDLDAGPRHLARVSRI